MVGVPWGLVAFDSRHTTQDNGEKGVVVFLDEPNREMFPRLLHYVRVEETGFPLDQLRRGLRYSTIQHADKSAGRKYVFEDDREIVGFEAAYAHILRVARDYGLTGMIDLAEYELYPIPGTDE